jgi:hypothetical protein
MAHYALRSLTLERAHMADITPNLKLPFLLASQADKHVSVNSAFSILDSAVQTSILSRSIPAQPSTPLDGDAYILPSGKTGTTWASLPDNDIAIFTDGGWLSYSPKIGFLAFDLSEAQHVVRTGTGWTGLIAPVNQQGGVECLVNGAFSIWQRGTSLGLAAGQSGYLADRWRHEAGTGGVATVSRVALTAGSQGLPQWAYYGVRHAQTTAATTSPRIEQRIENIRRFGATSITFSAFLRVATGTASVVPKAVLNFGTGGPAASSVSASAWNVTTTWQRFSATFAIPSIAATTTLEWPGNCLGVGIDLPSGQAVTVEMAGAQVDFGAAMAAIRSPDSAGELARCQRYFCKTFPLETAPASNTIDGGGIFAPVYSTVAFGNILPWIFPMVMRASPQVTTYNPYLAGGAGMALAGGGNHTLDIYTANANGVMLRNTQTLPGAPLPVNLHVTAQAEL